MFKSIFLKYFTVTSVLISLVFVLTAGVQAVFARRYWLEEKRVALVEQAETVATMVSKNTMTIQPGSYDITDEIRPVLKYFADATGGAVLVVDNDYHIVLCSHMPCEHTGEELQGPIRNELTQSELFTVGRLGGLFEENQYIAGVAFKSSSGELVGHVLATTPATMLTEYITENLQMYGLAGIVVLMIAFVVLYIVTYRLVRPLRQMAAITRQFSKGDFSGRVKVRGGDEVAELAYALNNMAVSLSSVEDMRRSFVANVSHDLKTPMTTISGFIDGILDGTIPADKRNEYLRIVSDETKRLSRLVRVMLDLSRIDSGQLKLTPVPFDLTEMMCSTLLSFESRIEEKHIEIEGIDRCESQTVYADYDLIQQVVYNLVDNAVKFTNEGGMIRLLSAHIDGRVVCTIRNTGAGVPAEELPYIFDRFYKSDRSRGLDKTGTGLGLYIVKSLIDLHNGEIMVRSVEGEYCEFTFWLPDLQKK